MENHKIGFIGAGNMATALIKGLIQSGTHERDLVQASDKDEKALKNISRQFGIRC